MFSRGSNFAALSHSQVEGKGFVSYSSFVLRPIRVRHVILAVHSNDTSKMAMLVLILGLLLKIVFNKIIRLIKLSLKPAFHSGKQLFFRSSITHLGKINTNLNLVMSAKAMHLASTSHSIPN